METTVRASTTKLKGSRFDRGKFKKVRGISKYEKAILSEKIKEHQKREKDLLVYWVLVQTLTQSN